MGERASDELRYTAFLSYSHKDSAAARRLHRRLEAYRMPKRLVGTERALGPVPERLAPIFRDREELPAATDLSETVREALAQSGSLIVLCSPQSAESLWVGEEIKVFRELHPDRPILAAVVEGEPPDCFPATLRTFGPNGPWHEPLAADFRPRRDGRRLGLLKLVAGITGVGLDALVQRDAQRKIRRVTAVTAAALIAMLAMAALTLVALNARGEAERQRAEAERQRTAAEGLVEFMLTDLRDRLRGVGRLDVMGAVNQRALAHYEHRSDLYDRPADAAMYARVLQAKGEDALRRDDRPAAAATLRDAYRRTSALVRRFPRDPNVLFAHAQSVYWIGEFHYLRDNLDAARSAWQRYQALAERLRQIGPNDPRWLREAGYAEGALCTVAVEQSPPDIAAATRSCTAALARMEEVRRLQPDDPAIVVALANRHAWTVDTWSVNGRWEQAKGHIARADDLARWLLRRDPANADYQDLWAHLQCGFGEQFALHGEHAEARRRIAEARTTIARLRVRDPDNASWRDLQQRVQRALTDVE
jgi:hypothetical protein